MDPLSLSVACHIGHGALAVACSKKVTVLEDQRMKKLMELMAEELASALKKPDQIKEIR